MKSRPSSDVLDKIANGSIEQAERMAAEAINKQIKALKNKANTQMV